MTFLEKYPEAIRKRVARWMDRYAVCDGDASLDEVVFDYGNATWTGVATCYSRQFRTRLRGSLRW